MEYRSENGNIILTNRESFELGDIFDCGQAFRWNKNGDNSYTGVASGRVLTVSESEKDIVFYDTSVEDFEGFWKNYFDLETDYSAIKAALSSDDVIKTAAEYGGGIRILKQDLWECVVSFIISASNNIPRIKKIIELLCENFGDKIIYRGEEFYSFPSPKRLAEVSREELGIIRCGFRDKYIIDAAKKFSEGEISEEMLGKMPTEAAKKKLMTIMGVGNKVADCVALFGLSRCESFPVDVWIKRVMEHIYFDKQQTVRQVSEFAAERFGMLGGYAQQYLFFYARENKIGL